MKKLLPLHEMTESLGLVSKSVMPKSGRKSYFNPEVKVAPMFLKMKTRMSQSGITLDWKERLEALKFLLEGRDVCDVKTDLTRGIVTDDTLDRTEKIYVEIGSFLVDISVKGDAEKECLKELFRQFEHYRKQMT